jgi:hypothetical protein
MRKKRFTLYLAGMENAVFLPFKPTADMKFDKQTIVSLILLIVIAALYRAMPGRIWGFAPHLAMAVFGGSVIRNKKLAFIFPVLSMFLSDLVYHILYLYQLTPIEGFYSGQLTNYLLIASLAIIGFRIRENKIAQIAAGAIAAPVVYFLASNFLVWAGGGGFYRPRNFSGLLQTYADGLPFFQTSLFGTLFFSAVLFGGYFLIKRYVVRMPVVQ